MKRLFVKDQVMRKSRYRGSPEGKGDTEKGHKQEIGLKETHTTKGGKENSCMVLFWGGGKIGLRGYLKRMTTSYMRIKVAGTKKSVRVRFQSSGSMQRLEWEKLPHP